MCEDGWFTGNDANLYYRAGLDTVEHSQVFIFSRKDRPGANLSSPFFVGPQRRTTTPSQNEKDHAANLANQFQSPETVIRQKVNIKDAISYNQKFSVQKVLKKCIFQILVSKNTPCFAHFFSTKFLEMKLCPRETKIP